ncbi:hypothetical protein HDZ31DRAFT_33813 [Schizophyllum fasciatum]
MHRALATPDLIACVSELVNRVTAYAMALTCRAWLSSALDRVWRDLTYEELMNHLLCFLPSDVYVPPDVRVVLHSSKASTPARWLRAPGQDEYGSLYTYSRRIRTLDLRHAKLSQLTMLSNNPPRRPLCPGLTAMELPPSALDSGYCLYPAFVLPFQSSTVPQIWITWKYNEWYRQGKLDLDTCVANTKRIRLHIESNWDSITKLPQLIGSRTDIVRGLTFQHLLDQYDWDMVAALPNLQTLTITWLDDTSQFPQPPSVPKPFRSLEKLSFLTHEDSKPYVATLLEHCGQLCLSSLSMCIGRQDDDRDAHPTDNWRGFLQAVNRHCTHHTLEALEFIDAGEMTRVSTDVLRSLLPFWRLKSLQLENKGGVELAVAAVAPFMRSWRYLRKLTLVPSIHDIMEDICLNDHALYINTCTVEGLLEIVRWGHDLESLAITVDFISDFQPSDWTEGQPRSASITELDFWNSKLDDPRKVAQLVEIAFPAVPDLQLQYSVFEFRLNMPFSPEWRLYKLWEQVHRFRLLVRDTGVLRGAPRSVSRLSGMFCSPPSRMVAELLVVSNES